MQCPCFAAILTRIRCNLSIDTAEYDYSAGDVLYRFETLVEKRNF